MNFADFSKRAKAIFAKIKWSQEQLVNGMLIEYDSDQIGKSSIIYQVSPDGEKSLLPDGQYKTKDGCLFVLTDGKVSSVEDVSNTPAKPVSKDPVKQAQSSQNSKEDEDKSDTEMNIPLKKPAAKVAPVKADAAEEMASDVATPETDTTGAADDTEDQASLQEVLTEALAPITAAINQILSALGSTTEMAKETKTELSKVKETVTKLADEPAPEKKETKVINNPFNKQFPEDVAETQTYKVLKAGSVKK